jgi:hypothetical protein
MRERKPPIIRRVDGLFCLVVILLLLSVVNDTLWIRVVLTVGGLLILLITIYELKSNS